MERSECCNKPIVDCACEYCRERWCSWCEKLISNPTPKQDGQMIEERFARMKMGLRLELVPSICNDVEETIEAYCTERERLARIDERSSIVDRIKNQRGANWTAASEKPQPEYDTLEDAFNWGSDHLADYLIDELQPIHVPGTTDDPVAPEYKDARWGKDK